MGNYLFAYHGGMMADTDEQRQAAMQAWGAWFGKLGPAIVDPGNPFAGSTSVNGSGANGDASSQLTGYTVVKAESLDAASALTEGCPVFEGGGSIDVYETIEVSM
ncbi:MAG TPA: YciI family protein [Solirubrobacteraceae bacterium]|jgi:hypothetical protein|nr:YciI family protein [Solirubrobacteraceae bacterium]